MNNFTPYLSSREGTNIEQASAMQALTSARHSVQKSYASRASNAADGIIPLGHVPEDGVVVSAAFQPETSQAGSATNYANLSIVNLGPTAAISAVIASHSLSHATQGKAALGKQAMTLSTGTALSVSAGDMLGISFASQGGGIAIVPGHAVVTYRRR